MSDEQDKQQLIKVLAALQQSSNQAVGPVPDVDEIDAWRRGELPSMRAAQVKSHLASDPDCMAVLRDLDAVDPLEQASPVTTSLEAAESGGWLARLRVWFVAPSPVLGGGLIAAGIALAVLLGPLLRQSPDALALLEGDGLRWDGRHSGEPALAIFATKSAMSVDPSLGVVRTGAAQAADERGWLSEPGWRQWASMQLAPPACHVGGRCTGETALGLAAGQWLVTVYHDCLADRIEQRWSAEEARSLAGAVSGLSAAIDSLAEALRNDAARQLCLAAAVALGF